MVKGTLWKVSQKKKRSHLEDFFLFFYFFIFQIAKIFQGIGQILAFFLFKKIKK